MKLSFTQIKTSIVRQIEESDWDDLLRIYRAAVDPDAELVEEEDGAYSIHNKD